jgi:CheY-like chemotaxis protein
MGQRLLLVDNDRGFLKEHQVSLEAAFNLEVTPSPEGVLARLESGDFAAVFVSVEVADNKGYALCSTIRKNPKLDAVKIALISAKATNEEYRRHQSLKGHADLYLHKPISPSALVAELRPLVPGLALDPDNPLGELVDTELGDDWLDGLKSVLDSPASAQAPAAGFGVRPPSPAQTQNLDDKAITLAGASRQELLEAQVAALQEELHAKDQRLKEAGAAAQQVQRQLNSVTLNLDELERSNQEVEALKVALAAKEAALGSAQQEREEARRVQDQLNATIEGLVAQQASLADSQQAALQEVAGHKEKTHTYQLELAGLEATMRGQGRDLAELGERLQLREAELAASQARVLERDQQLLARQEVVQQHLEEITRLAGQLAALKQDLDEARILHEGQQLELMNGLDGKEAELSRLNQLVADQLEAYGAVEREKQTLHGQLSEHRDRLRNLDVLLQEIQDKVRRGSDLARG